MLIFEGMNYTGKTVAAQKAAKMLNYEYSHMSRPDDDFDFFWGYIKMMHHNVVQDRFTFSEIAYADAHNTKSRIEFNELMLLQNYVACFPAYTVVIYYQLAHAEKMLRSRLHSSCKQPYDLPTLLSINDKYSEMRRFYTTPNTYWFMLSPNFPYLSDRQLDLIVDRYTVIRKTVEYISKREWP